MKGSVNKFKPIQDDPAEIEHLQDVLIVRIEEALFFANTGNVYIALLHMLLCLFVDFFFIYCLRRSGQLKDRLRRLEMFGDMSIHPSENPRRSESLYTIFDVGSMPTIDAR